MTCISKHYTPPNFFIKDQAQQNDFLAVCPAPLSCSYSLGLDSIDHRAAEKLQLTLIECLLCPEHS